MTTRATAVREARSMLAGVALVLLALVAAPLPAKNNAFRDTKHGDRTRGPQRRQSLERGSCGQCHQQHASHETSGSTASRDGMGLFASNDNELCFACHLDRSQLAVWPGNSRWSRGGHATSARMVWPGPVPPARNSADANKCVNCHDPHGNRDARGVIPAMLVSRQEDLCTRCHDGSRAQDVRTDFQKAFPHPFAQAGRHDTSYASDGNRFGSAADDRHAECTDCHNPHEATSDPVAPNAPDASNAIVAVSRVQVTNGSQGSKPNYTWRAADETGFAREYELCFKCHSGWTKQPIGQTDFGVVTNPANASYHPIQAAGKNRNIDPAAFTQGWSWDRLTYCGDCHGSDDQRVRGPHGSAYRYILKKPVPTSATPQRMQPDDLCFDCHTYEVYANPDASADRLRASRFNAPNGPGHAYHVGSQQIPCYACHETHGSVRNPALIATRRTPGIVSYTQTPLGGTCLASCHGSRTYSVNYGR